METIVKYAQELVYSLVSLMPSSYQKASLNALLGRFLAAQGHRLPQHAQEKSASVSRFLNHYQWSTRAVIRTTRKTILPQLAWHRQRKNTPLQVLIDLTSLEKCGKFLHLGNLSNDPETPDPWISVLNGKRGLDIVMLYLVIGQWRVPWTFRVWRRKGYPSPSQLACKLLATVPAQLSQGRVVVVQADTEFGSIEFLKAVRQRAWRAVVGMRCNRRIQDLRTLKQLYRKGRRGQQVHLVGIAHPVTVSWFWLKRADNKRQLRVVSSDSYSGVYLVRLGRKRWAIEGCFKTIKHRFGLHRFGQATKLGVYRWLLLSLMAYLLAHWIDQSSLPPVLDWKAASDLALLVLFPSVLWFRLLRSLQINADIAAQYGFEISLKSLPKWAY